MSDLAKRVFRAFDPVALDANQQDLYADLDQARGDANAVNSLRSIIGLSARPTAQLLAGHSGSGKSTELKRMQQQLTADGFFVVYFEAGEDLDRNDVDFLEVLVALTRQVVVQLKNQLDIRLRPNYFRDRFQRLKNLLTTEIEFEKLDLDVALMNFGLSLKHSPDHRRRVRALLETDSPNWLAAANQVLADATAKLIAAKTGASGLVVLLDDLDKMVVRPVPGAGHDTAENLFLHRASSMTGFQCHVVYTVPITLTRQLTQQRLKSYYHGKLPVIAMTKLKTRPPRSKPFQPGLAAFRDLVQRRLESIDVRPQQVFGTDTLDQLIALSGGEPAALMRYVREATILGLPVSKRTVERVAAAEHQSYDRQLLQEHLGILAKIRKNGRFKPTADEVRYFDELLLSRAVLQYVNDEEWYGLNPVLENLELPT